MGKIVLEFQVSMILKQWLLPCPACTKLRLIDPVLAFSLGKATIRGPEHGNRTAGLVAVADLRRAKRVRAYGKEDDARGSG